VVDIVVPDLQPTRVRYYKLRQKGWIKVPVRRGLFHAYLVPGCLPLLHNDLSTRVACTRVYQRGEISSYQLLREVEFVERDQYCQIHPGPID
jgi:hypothetical protein